MQHRQVQELLLPALKQTVLNGQQMLVGIIIKHFSKAKVTSLAYIAKADSLVVIQSLFQPLFPMDHSVFMAG
jgi:hypothetical protein